MPPRKPTSARALLTEKLRQLLGERATAALLKKLDPDLAKGLKAGMAFPTLAEMLARKVVRLALEKDSANQWAVELVFERIEGKAAASFAGLEDGQKITERLDEVTAEHLNALAADYARPAENPRPAEDGAPGPAADVLPLSQDRPAHSEAPGGEPPLAAVAP